MGLYLLNAKSLLQFLLDELDIYWARSLTPLQMHSQLGLQNALLVRMCERWHSIIGYN
mgnify:CR=1 FL=1